MADSDEDCGNDSGVDDILHFGDTDDEQQPEEEEHEAIEVDGVTYVTNKGGTGDKMEIDKEKDDEEEEEKDAIVFTPETIKKGSTQVIPLHTDLSGRMIKELPTRVDDACRWDCHQFEGVPHFWCKYDKKRDIFRAFDLFCSPECTKAFLIATAGADLPKLIAWWRMMLKRVYKIPASKKITPALPRQMLKLFNRKTGMEIDEFRKASQIQNRHFQIINPPLYVSTMQVSEIIPMSKAQQQRTVAYHHHSKQEKQQQKFKLYRTKPLPHSESSITKFMGIKKQSQK
jgi:hypothetical protein